LFRAVASKYERLSREQLLLDIHAVQQHASARQWGDFIAARITPEFGASAEMIAKRLRVEKL